MCYSAPFLHCQQVNRGQNTCQNWVRRVKADRLHPQKGKRSNWEFINLVNTATYHTNNIMKTLKVGTVVASVKVGLEVLIVEFKVRHS